MYSGLLPDGLSEADLSPDEEETDTHTLTDTLTDTHTDTHTLTQPDTHTETSPAEPDPSSSPSSDHCLPGVSQDLWQKFKELQKERAVQTSKQPEVKRRRRKWRRKGLSEDQAGDAEGKREHEEARQKHWEELTQYFGSNARFQPPASSRPPVKSGLEKSMERAIAEGDYGKAEELSDRLATRELAVNIAQAADCRDFAQAKKEEEELREARKRRKQLAWGFEPKKRWETKSNMGYM